MQDRIEYLIQEKVDAWGFPQTLNTTYPEDQRDFAEAYARELTEDGHNVALYEVKITHTPIEVEVSA